MRLKLSYLFLTAALTICTQMHAQAVTTLDTLRDHKRVLLVFAGSRDARVEEQWNTLVQHRAQAAERDLTTVLLTRSRTKMHDGERPPQAVVAMDEEQRLRHLFHVSKDEFAVILIGKDGGEKLRTHQPITWQTLADTIDSMPMRRAEVRHSR